MSIKGETSRALIERVAQVLTAEICWDGERTRREIDSFIAELATFHGVSPEMLEKRTRNRSLTCA
jgi:hypothetical protein